MAKTCDATDPGDVLLEVSQKAADSHVAAAGESRLVPMTFTVSPEAAAAVRAVAGIRGISQGGMVSIGIAVAAEFFCWTEGDEFRAVFEQRMARAPKSAPAPAKKSEGGLH